MNNSQGARHHPRRRQIALPWIALGPRGPEQSPSAPAQSLSMAERLGEVLVKCKI